ncbi:MAG: hypothetical protein ACE5MM_08775 [Nitrospiraceae bacterium]
MTRLDCLELAWRLRAPLAGLIILVGFTLTTIGCKPDESPLVNENEALRKQVAKLDSVIVSLQDGNKVMQQQINLLNQELREARKQTKRVEAQRKEQAAKLAAEVSKNRKLAVDNQRIASERARAIPTLRVEEKGSQAKDLSKPLTSVSKAVETALSRNGYKLQVSLQTEKTAVYVTSRKVSAPASLEQSGFRNQYLVSLQKLSSEKTRLKVKADFEKIAQGGRILSVGPEEQAEIERRLIDEISKALEAAGKV